MLLSKLDANRGQRITIYVCLLQRVADGNRCPCVKHAKSDSLNYDDILFIIVCAELNSRTACVNFCDIGFVVVFRALHILSVLLRLQTQMKTLDIIHVSITVLPLKCETTNCQYGQNYL